MKWVGYILVVLAVFSLFIPTNFAYAQISKDRFTIQTIWVTGNNSCFHNDTQRLNEYQNEIILKYLSLYGIYPVRYPVQCMNGAEYDSYQPPDYTDLLIVIYNKNIGRDVLHQRNMGGYFLSGDEISKNGLRIEVCECPSYDYNPPEWVISHELAHFALYYLGYSKDTWVDWVHDTQAKYYAYCPDGDTTSWQCNGLWQKYEGENKNYKVMKVYPGAYEKTPPQVKFVNYISSGISDDSFSNNDSTLKLLQRNNNQVEQDSVLTDWQISKLEGKIRAHFSSLDSLNNGMKVAYNSIKASEEKNHSNQAREHVNKAWDVYLEIKPLISSYEKELYDMENSIDDAIKYPFSYNKNTYEIFSTIIDYDIGANIEKVGDKMQYISQELEYAEKEENKNHNQFCLLFWCV